MKLSFLALPTLLAVATASIEERRAQRRLSKDFLQAMHSSPEVLSAPKIGRPDKIRQLHENLVKSSRKLYNNQNANNGQQGYASYQEGQAYADVGTWNGQYWEFEGEVPFDLTSRSFKYSGCAAIKTYDTERAAENGNPMVIDTFAVFRLCPADKCNKYSVTGCGKNYGEYAVEMKTYLGYILGFYDERFESYCEYCTPCDYEYEALARTTLQQCYTNLEQQQYGQAQQSQQQSWQEYYNANNGDMSGWNVNGQNSNGDQNFQNYNKYYNSAHTGSGSSYSGTSNVYGSYGQAKNSGNYANYNGNYGNGNRKLEDAADGEADANANQNGNQNGAAAANGYWGADGVWYAYAQDDENIQFQQQVCQDGSTCDYCEFMSEQEFSKCDDYVCRDYYTYCSDLYGERKQFDISEFLECAPYNTQSGDVYYLGPHCGSDHYTISLGVFSDENCLEYVGEDVTLSKVLGFQYSDEDLFQLPKECISCDGAADYEESLSQQTNGRYGDYVTAPETDKDGVVAVCRALYEGSAQCNMHINNFNSISQYMSQYERDVEKMTCSFIENIIDGAYDESGEIFLSTGDFDFHDWRNPKQLKRVRMPAGQAVMLSLSMIVFAALLATVVYTQRSFRRGKGVDPWTEQGLSPVQLAKTTSGIVMARSRSGPGSAPLI